MTITNPVLLRAKQDYNPSIAKVNDNVIRDCAKEMDLSDASNNVETQFAFMKDWNIEDVIHYIFALNSVNFKFWDLTPKFVRYSHNGHVGALAANEGFHLLYEKMKEHKFDTSVLTPELMQECYGDIPDIDLRIDILQESLDPALKLALRAICIKAFKQEAVSFDLVEKIVEMMPKSFDDPYRKKVQLAIYEIMEFWNFIKGTKIHMPDMTVAADYQLPKVLEGMGIISYSDEVKNMIASQKELDRDSPEELAIRSATIVACEKIRRFLNVSVPVLDRYLWLARNNYSTNFHLTYTTDY